LYTWLIILGLYHSKHIDTREIKCRYTHSCMVCRLDGVDNKIISNFYTLLSIKNVKFLLWIYEWFKRVDKTRPTLVHTTVMTTLINLAELGGCCGNIKSPIMNEGAVVKTSSLQVVGQIIRIGSQHSSLRFWMLYLDSNLV